MNLYQNLSPASSKPSPSLSESSPASNGGEPELTAALAKYEKGVALLTQCHRLLDQAEQSVALLTGVDERGNPLTTPFDGAATITREVSSPAATSPDTLAAPPTKRKTSARASTGKSLPPAVDDPISDTDPPF